MKSLLIIISAIILISVVSCTKREEKSENLGQVTTQSAVTEDGKQIVRVGTFGYVDPLFSDYLNMPKDVQIEIVNYYNDDELALDKAVISGDIPDVLCFPVDYMQKMINQNIMADLYTLMDI